MKKHLLIGASLFWALTTIFAAPTASAQAQYAVWLGVYPACTGCHASQDFQSKGNLLPGATWNHLAVSTPTVPTCTGGQVLNSAKTACVTPTPTCTGGQVLNTAQTACVTPTPTCTGGQVLNAAQTACVTPTPTCTGGQVLNAAQTACVTPTPTCAAPQVLNVSKTACVIPAQTPTCVAPQVLNASKTACVIPAQTPTCMAPQVLNAAQTACVTPPSTKTNTKPVLNSVTQQWDIEAGQLLTIPLSVKDAEQDEFMMTGSVAGSTFSKVYPNAGTLLPTIDFQWTPTAAQANKIYSITFMAKETKTTQKLASNKVSVRIRVWPAGNRDVASVNKLNVSTSVWKAGKLTLTGNVVLNSLLTATERQAFIAKKLDLTIFSGKSATGGTLIGTVPLTLDNKGNWSVSLTVTQAPCDITLQYEGQNASRTVTGVTCTASATAITIANGANNNFPGENEGGHSHGESEHDD